MHLKQTIAEKITKLATSAAYRAAGQVSIAGTYQPQEPKALQNKTK